MNKKEALEKCLALWTWLAEHPTETKATAYRALNLTEDHCFCPACKYALHQDELDQYCGDHCPISLFRRLSVGKTNGCLQPESPYHTYYSAPTYDHKVHASAARQIVEAVKSDLDAFNALTPSST